MLEMFRILIADDDPRMRQVIREYVAELASDILEASDGAEAMALYATQRPDWVVMDWRMTPLDGIRATAVIKASFSKARIVVVSQHNEPGVRALATEAGACAFFLKEDLEELPAFLTEFAGDVVDIASGSSQVERAGTRAQSAPSQVSLTQTDGTTGSSNETHTN